MKMHTLTPQKGPVGYISHQLINCLRIPLRIWRPGSKSGPEMYPFGGAQLLEKAMKSNGFEPSKTTPDFKLLRKFLEVPVRANIFYKDYDNDY